MATQRELRQRALKAWETRRENERKRKASASAYKAWETRRARAQAQARNN